MTIKRASSGDTPISLPAVVDGARTPPPKALEAQSAPMTPLAPTTAADRARLAEPAPASGSNVSTVTVRLDGVLSGKATFHDNLAALITKLNASVGSTEPKITPQLAVALFEVTREGGISPKEVRDATRIARYFTAKGDANAAVLSDLADQIRSAYTDQGFLARLGARVLDIGRKNVQPNLTAEAVAATRPDELGAWVGQHASGAIVPDGQPAKNTRLNMCPMLGSLIREGSLKLDQEGNIDLEIFNTVMIERLGITPQRAAVTVGTGFIGNHVSDAFAVANGKLNIGHLAGSFLDHVDHGDTAIVKGGVFHEDAFQTLCAHSSDGKTLCIADFAKAINDQLARDGGFVTRTRGLSEDIFEMAALINTLGYIDAQGERRIGFDTLRDFYQHQKLPSAEELRARKPTGVIEHVATMTKMGVEMAKDALQGREGS